jgi:hypothetical protein
MLVVFVLLLLEETTITLKVFLWRFPFNFIWKCTIMLSKNSWHRVLEVEEQGLFLYTFGANKSCLAKGLVCSSKQIGDSQFVG